MSKVSIIIPIYNSEKYLEECLYSVISQTLRDIEIILIDDGSTDSSPEICDKYAAIDNRIKVVHKRNEGMGKAYNLGIEIATGEYIGFVESDDYIDRNMYKELYENAQIYDSDLVKCGFYHWYSSENITIPPIEQMQLRQMETIKQPFCITDYKQLLFYHSSIWASLYKSEFIKNFKFSEQKGASYQDFSFMIDVLTKAKKISTINQNYYYWRIGNSNHMSSTSRGNKNLLRIVEQLKLGKDILLKANLYNTLYSEFQKHCMIVSFNFYGRCPDDYKEEFFNKLKDYYSDIKITDLFNIMEYFDYNELKFLLYIICDNRKEMEKQCQKFQ